MSAQDQQKIIDDKGKWQFIYKQMMYSSTFNKMKDKIELYLQEKERR